MYSIVVQKKPSSQDPILLFFIFVISLTSLRVTFIYKYTTTIHRGSATRIVDNCNVNAYVRTKISLSASPIPVYTIPGDNDIPLCPDPSAGLKLYKEHVMTIDTMMYWNVTNTTKSYIVNRQVPNREENFAFLYKRVLFIGLNMVNNVNGTD